MASKCSVFQSKCPCNPTNIDTSQQCCTDIIGEGSIQYFHIIYCTLNDDKRIYLPLLILCIIYLLIILAIISQHYFAELMHEIAKYLHLSQNVAGATFVAWGNGIATMSSSIAAISHGGEQVKLGLGALFGVAVFNISFTCATIAWIAHKQKTKIDQYAFIRDTLYLIFVSLYVLMASFLGNMSLFSSCILLLTYIVYVVCIWITNIYSKHLEQKNFENKFKQTVEIILESTTSNMDSYDIVTQLDRNDSFGVLLSQSKQERMEDILKLKYKSVILKVIVAIVGSPIVIVWFLLKVTVPLPNHKHWNDLYACLHCITVPPLFYFVFIWKRYHTVYHVLCAIFVGIALSIIVCLKLRFKKPKSLKLLLQQKKTTLDVNESTYGTIDTYQQVTELSGVGQKVLDKKDESRCGYMRTRSDLMENILEHDYFGYESYTNYRETHRYSEWVMDELSTEPVMKGFFLFLSFMALIAWIQLISEELVRILSVLGVISRVDFVLLGAFVLSLCNSVPDFFNNVSVAMKGNAKMAVAACFGGSSLQICIGFSVGTLIGSIRAKDHVLAIEHSKYVLIGCLFTNVSCSLYAAIVSLNKWRLTKMYAFCGYLCYIAFVLVLVVSYYYN